MKYLKVITVLLILSFATHTRKGAAMSTPDGAEQWRRLYHMSLPVQDVHSPLTPAQIALDMKQGRPLPAREVLQPTLDRKLPNYDATPRGAPLQGHYKVAASDILPNLVKMWIHAFQKRHPGVTIALRPPYSGSFGAEELLNGTVDVVFSSRELRPQDVASFRARFGHDPLSVPVSGGTYRQFGFLDAIAFVVHGENPIDRVSLKELDAILSTTRCRGGGPIRTWGELGVGGAEKPINVYAIQPWNGFEEFVRQRVLGAPGRRGEWRSDLRWAAGGVVFPIAGSVAADRYGLGYTGMAYLDSAVKTLAIAGEANATTFFPPSYEAVALADYPLSRVTYFNANKAAKQPLPPALQAFLTFILSRQGQRLVRKQELFLPLRAWQIENARALFL